MTRIAPSLKTIRTHRGLRSPQTHTTGRQGCHVQQHVATYEVSTGSIVVRGDVPGEGQEE